jgi:hypothetical protein
MRDDEPRPVWMSLLIIASVCAKLVSMIHDLPLVSEDPTIICQIDFANAFQAPNRQLGTNDCILGRASREYDEGRVKIGDHLSHLPAITNFFPYFSSMNDVPSRNRFTDHYIAGPRGGPQGDPLEMTRFCLTVHTIWGRVLGRHQATLGAAYADDAYLMGRIEPTLMAIADTVRSFRQDADREVCLGKCTIYLPGIPEERANHLIRGHIRLRPRVRAKQVRRYLQGRRNLAHLRRPPHKVPPLEILHEHAPVFPVAQRHSR